MPNTVKSYTLGRLGYRFLCDFGKATCAEHSEIKHFSYIAEVDPEVPLGRLFGGTCFSGFE